MIKENWENVDMIGVLATKEELQRVYGKENIFVNNTDRIQFYVKLLSMPYDYPSSDNRSKYIACYQTNLTQIEDNFYASDEERVENFYNEISNKLFRLNVQKKVDYDINQKVYYNGYVKEIIYANDKMLNEGSLNPIPIFNKHNSVTNVEEFEKLLASGKVVGDIHNVSIEKEDYPQFVIYNEIINDYEDRFYVYGNVKSFEYIENAGFKYDFENEIKKYEIEDIDFNEMLVTENNIGFITNDLIRKFEENIDAKEVVAPVIKKMVEDNHQNVKKEKEFLEHLFKKLESENLLYDKKDIINFHVSMKTSKLVILSGMSGTGKSKLIKSYAAALGLKDNFKFIPVSPSWNDDSDLIGYVDTINNIYRPDDNGLIETLIQASDNPDKLYIICFDEMNLSRVEHYFSKFLSILEGDIGSRQLQLYNKEMGGKLYNSTKYRYEIKIGKNVRFVGTVNIDDTTHHFSNKVLDRSDLISLDVMPIKELIELSKKEKRKVLEDDSYEKEFIEYFCKESSEINLSQDNAEFLQELHNELVKVNPQIGIGPRVVKHIDYYLKNIPDESKVLSDDIGFDFQLSQRVLSKVRGSREELTDLVGLYDADNDEVVNSKIIDLMDKFSSISDFTNARSLIRNKAKELKINGYTF